MRASAHRLAYNRCSINIPCCSAFQIQCPPLVRASPSAPSPGELQLLLWTPIDPSASPFTAPVTFVSPDKEAGQSLCFTHDCPTPSPGPVSEQELGKCFLKDPGAWFSCLPASALLSLGCLFFLSQPMQLCFYCASPSTNASFPRMSFLSKLAL